METPHKRFTRETTRELRRTSRVPADFPVRWSRDGNGRTGRALDLSQSGLFIESPAPAPVGSELELQLFLRGDAGAPVTVRAQVMRLGVARRRVQHGKVHHLTLACHGFGCSFVEDPPQAVMDLWNELFQLDDG